MKPSLPRRTARILTALLAAASVATSCSGPEPHHIVLMSYNIRNGIGADNVRDLTRTADVIRRTAPDFVALQEVDSATRRSEGRFVAAELGRLTGMHARFGRAIDFEGGSYGVALLSREEPLALRRIPLPGREEARVLLMAEFPECWLCVTHLSLTDEDQRASLPLIARATDTCRKPVLLAGDFNMANAAEVAEGLGARFRLLSDTTACTFPAGAPTVRIDYIAGCALPQGFRLLRSATDPTTTASDHAPLWVELAFE